MSENRFSCGTPSLSGSRDMVCIETNKILDSCRDRDCYENLRVYLTDCGNEIIEHTSSIRVKDSCIAGAYVSIDPVKFNRGFYSVNVKFYLKLVFEACVGNGRSQEFDGVAVLEKNVVLFGGESNVSIYKSSPDAGDYCSIPELCCGSKNVPIAVVEVVEPIILNAKILEDKSHSCCCCCCCDDFPHAVTSKINGMLCTRGDEEKYLAVSVGIFSVIRIVRPAQYLVNATEYAVPDKECVAAGSDDPCCVFNSMPFPIGEFSAGGHANGCRGDVKEPRDGGKHCCN